MRFSAATCLLTLILLFSFGGARYAPAEIKTVYVVVPTHLDIGFTAPPDTVARSYKDCIDHAIRLCEEYPDYFYTIECAWQLREWMKRSSPEEVHRLSALVKSGKVEVGGAFASMHSAMMSGECVNRMFDLGLSLEKELGGEIRTAIQDDVPGYTWAYPQAMRQHGIKYFLTGINTSFGGEPKLGPKDNPFYWEGPDGSRVLTWIARGYTDGSEWGIGIWEKEDDVFHKVPEQAGRLEKAGYPYDAFLVMASPGDNVTAAATEKIHRIISKWNASGNSPALKLATPRQFFEYMEAKYADRFPTHRGDWSGHWEPAKLGSPRLVSRMRFAQRILPAAEALWSVLALSGAARFPAEDIAAAWDDLLTISEHSAGAGTGWPNLTTREQVIWENWQHAFRSLSAFHGTSMLMEEGMKALAESISADYPFIVVFNPLPWSRFGFVEVNMPPEVLDRGLTIRSGEGGDEIEWELLEDGRTIRFGVFVGGVGYRVFRVSPGRTERPPVSVEADTLDTCQFAIAVDSSTGYIKSIYDKETRQELVEKGGMFGSLHIVPHPNAVLGGAGRLAKAKAARVEVINGKTYRSLRVRRSEGPLIETSITVPDQQSMVPDAIPVPDVVRIENTLDISKIPGDDHVAAILEFPFNLDLETLKIAVDGPNHFRRWPEDYLPGTARTGQVVQSYALLQDAKSFFYFMPVEAPIVSFGEIGLQSLNKPRATRVYSYLFDRNVLGQNKDTGRTRYDEVEPALGTKTSFTYYLHFCRVSHLGAAWACGCGRHPRHTALEATIPLFGRFQSPWGKQEGKLGADTAKSFLAVSSSRIEVSSATLISSEGESFWQLRLQDSSGMDLYDEPLVTVGVPIRSICALDAAARQPRTLGKGPTFQLALSPFKTITVLVQSESRAR